MELMGEYRQLFLYLSETINNSDIFIIATQLLQIYVYYSHVINFVLSQCVYQGVILRDSHDNLVKVVRKNMMVLSSSFGHANPHRPLRYSSFLYF